MSNTVRHTSRRSQSPRRRRTPSRKKKFFRRHPHWAWWTGGIGIIILYVWLFYSFFVSPTGFRWRALYGDANYPEGYEIHGIDISHYQGDIDWEKLRYAMIGGYPLRFIMIKSTEGSSRIDTNFYDNFFHARENGFSRRLVPKLIIFSTTCISKTATCRQYSI